MRHTSSVRSGFTLIEILIVVAVIGILATIIIALLSGSTDKASANKAKTTLGSLKNALAICCSNPSTALVSWNGSGAAPALCSGATSTYPTPSELGASTVTYAPSSACNTSSPALQATISGLNKTECNGVWTINYTGVVGPAGC